MISASSDFINKINSPSRHFVLRLTNTLNNEEIALDYKSATITKGSCGGSDLAIGCAFSSYIEVVAEFADILLESVEAKVELGLLLDDDSYEYVPIGYYTIQKPTRQQDTMTFQMVDRMLSKLNAPYLTELTFPTTISAVISELEAMTGVGIVLRTGIGGQTIETKPTTVTCRDAIQMLATLSLGFAYVNATGEVVIDTFTRDNIDIVDIDYDYVKTQPQMDEQSSTIGGVSVQVTSDSVDEEGEEVPGTTYVYGSGNMVSVACPYMTETIFDLVKTNIVGYAYNGGSVQFMGNPLIEPSDKIRFTVAESDDPETEDDESLVDAVQYIVPAMEIVHTFDGGLTTQITAPGSFEFTDSTNTPGVFQQFMDSQAVENASSRALIGYAQQAANEAAQAASAAQTSANNAATAAANAQNSANTANTAANNALTQLGTIENVVGTLNWISEHGTYAASTDTEVVAGKLYFTRTGTGTDADPYVYNVVVSPTGSPEDNGYYELDSVDEAVSAYVSAHLALTDEGLFVVFDNSGYKVKITNDGVYIINPQGAVVAVYSTYTQIGKTGETHVIVDYHSLNLLDEFGDSYLYCGDRRDRTGVASLTEMFTGDGGTNTFDLVHDILDIKSATVDGVTVTCGKVAGTNNRVMITPVPAAGSTIEILYTTEDVVRSFTFGDRVSRYGTDGLAIGDLSASFGRNEVGGDRSLAAGHLNEVRARDSVAFGERNIVNGGYGCLASGSYCTSTGYWGSSAFGVSSSATATGSFASGNNAEATADYAHALGIGVKAASSGQLAVGKYNLPNTNGAYLFIVGNGSAGSRSNAFTVNQSGTIQSAGSVLADGAFGSNGRTAYNDGKDGCWMSTNSFYTSHSIYTGGKTAYDDGATGCYIGLGGVIHMTHATAGSGIYWHYAKSASNTASIVESASGVLATSGRLNVGGAMIASGAVGTHGRASYNDSAYGMYATTGGSMSLRHDGSSGAGIIGWFYGSESSWSSQILQSASGVLEAVGYFKMRTTGGTTRRVAIGTATDASASSGQHISHMWCGSAQVYINAEWGGTYDTRSISVPSSDIRLKKNVKDSAVNALPVLNKIRIREFDWKDGRHQIIGMVADEIEKIDPRLSVGGGKDADGNICYKSVDTFYLEGYLVKGVQELYQTIEDLKHEIAQLKGEAA